MKPTQPLLPAQLLKPRTRQLQRMKHILMRMRMIMAWIMLLLMMVVLMALFL